MCRRDGDDHNYIKEVVVTFVRATFSSFRSGIPKNGKKTTFPARQKAIEFLHKPVSSSFDYKWLHWWGHGWWITFSNVNWMNLSRKQHFESFRSCLELNLKWKSFAELLLEMKMPMFQQLILSSGIQGADLNQHGPVQGKPQRPNCIHWRRPWRRWCLGIVRLMAKCQNICFLVDMKAKEE